MQKISNESVDSGSIIKNENYYIEDILNEETYKTLKKTADKKVVRRSNTQGMVSKLVGVTKDGRILYTTTSGTTPGKIWAQQLKFKDLQAGLDILASDKTMKQKDIMNLIVSGDLLVHCFPENTLVKTINGNVKISDIKRNDYVLTHDFTYNKVEIVYKHRFKGNLKDIRLENGFSLKGTINHKIQVVDKCNFIWKSLSDIKLKDKVVTDKEKDRSNVFSVVSIEDVFYEGFVYNLSVENSHSYIANNIIVHNCNDPSWKYWGWQYIGTKKNFAMYPNNIPPNIRNPRRTGSVCFSGDTLVVTEKGLREIKDIEVGDKVYTHKGRLRKVLHTFVNESDCSVYRFSDFTVECTPNHKFLTLNNKWVSITNIPFSEGVPTIQINHKDTYFILSKEDCFILGLIIGCGTILDDRVVLSIVDYDTFKEVRKYTDKLVYENSTVLIKDKDILKKTKDVLGKSLEKSLDFSQKVSDIYLDNIIKGILYTCTKDTEKGIQFIYNNNNYNTILYLLRRTYSVRVLYQKIYKNIFISGDEVREVLNSYKSDYMKNKFKKSVSSHESYDGNQYFFGGFPSRLSKVYNIEVEEDESYLITDNFIPVHNCKHIYNVLSVLPFNTNTILKMFKQKGLFPTKK